MMPVLAKQINEAVEVLKKGGVIVFPTETAYGLGADATNARAVRKLMAVKGREGWKTPPLIAADMEMVERFALFSSRLRALANQFWPGPLTIVVPIPGLSQGYPRVNPGITLGLVREVVRDGTIAIRVSSNETARELSKGIGAPLVATSANVAGQKTCYTVTEAHAQFDVRLLHPDYYLDGGPLPLRPPSTIIIEQDGDVRVLRQGEITISIPYVA